MFDLTTASLLAPTFVLLLIFWKFVRSRQKGIPGPFWAHLTDFYRVSLVWSGDCASKIQHLHNIYGPVVRTGPNHVVVSDPAAMFMIYGQGVKFKKTDFYRIFALFYNGTPIDTVFSTRDIGYHKTLKMQTAARFSPTSIRSAEPAVDMCIGVFDQTMREIAGTEIDLAQWLKYWAFDVNSSLGFKNSFGFMKKREDIKEIISGIDEGFHYGAIVGQIPEWNTWLFENKAIMIFLRTVASLGDPTTEIVQLIEERIKDSEKDLDPEDDCLLIWLRNERRKPDSNMSHAEMIMHLANYFVAGSVATATSLAGVFYYLIKNDSAYGKLLNEIREAEASERLSSYVTYKQSLEMPYLQAVLKEAMRLCPTNNIPLERFVPPSGFEVCGHNLPEGTNIGISARMIHRNPLIYGADVEGFRPERWIEADSSSLKEMERHFFAFGRGDRSCSGRGQAMMEMGKFVTQVLRKFDIEWASSQEDWSIKSYWMPEQRGLNVKFRPRLTSH